MKRKREEIQIIKNAFYRFGYLGANRRSKQIEKRANK
jgi:hypothetical protein